MRTLRTCQHSKLSSQIDNGFHYSYLQQSNHEPSIHCQYSQCSRHRVYFRTTCTDLHWNLCSCRDTRCHCKSQRQPRSPMSNMHYQYRQCSLRRELSHMIRTSPDLKLCSPTSTGFFHTYPIHFSRSYVSSTRHSYSSCNPPREYCHTRCKFRRSTPCSQLNNNPRYTSLRIRLSNL